MIIELNGSSVIISNNNQKTIRVNSDIFDNSILELLEVGNWCAETAVRCVSVSFRNSSFFFLQKTAIPNLVIYVSDIVYIVPLNIQQSVYSFADLEHLAWRGIQKYYYARFIKNLNLTQQSLIRIDDLKVVFIKSVIDISLNIQNELVVSCDEDRDILLNFCKLICIASPMLNLLASTINEPKKLLEFIKEVFQHYADDIRLNKVILSDTHLSEVISAYNLLIPSDGVDTDHGARVSDEESDKFSNVFAALSIAYVKDYFKDIKTFEQGSNANSVGVEEIEVIGVGSISE